MKAEKVPYIFIAGASYTGSTLLALLLDSHPQMVSISEVGGPTPGTDIETYTCSCGARLLDCPFYLELETQIRTLGSDFSLRDWRTLFRLSRHRALDIPLVRPLRNTLLEKIRDLAVPLVPGYNKAIREIALRNLHFAKSVLFISGKNTFVDAQKDSIRIKFLSGIDNLDLKVIHLVRDVRGGASSYMRRHGRDDAAWAARAWCIANMNTERAKRYVSSDRWMRIRYGDLCDDYQSVVDGISDFAGVERAKIPHDFFEKEHHIIGNEMRLKRTQRVTRDESWKKLLSQDDIDTIARVAGEANRYFGFGWP